MLNFEIKKEEENIVYINGDKDGFELLIQRIQWIIEKKDHDHLMTEAWGGDELSAEGCVDDASIVHQVNIRFCGK